MTKVSLSISMEAVAAERFRQFASDEGLPLSAVIERFALAGESALTDAPQVSSAESRREPGRRKQAKDPEPHTDAPQETTTSDDLLAALQGDLITSSPTTTTPPEVSPVKPHVGEENGEPLALESQDLLRGTDIGGQAPMAGSEPAERDEGGTEGDTDLSPIREPRLALPLQLPDVSSSETLAEKVYNCMSTEAIDIGQIAQHLGTTEMEIGAILDDLETAGEPVKYEYRVGRFFCWLTT